MNWNKSVRQVHRWLSVLFTVTVIANIVNIAAFGPEVPPGFVTYSPLPPLFLLMFTGLYLFVLPYTSRWRSGRSTD